MEFRVFDFGLRIPGLRFCCYGFYRLQFLRCRLAREFKAQALGLRITFEGGFSH